MSPCLYCWSHIERGSGKEDTIVTAFSTAVEVTPFLLENYSMAQLGI